MHYDSAPKNAVAIEKSPTLNDRLNKVLDSMSYQCERLEAVLARVNGTPTKIENAKAGNAPRPTHPLVSAVSSLEEVNGRLADLATGVENIA